MYHDRECPRKYNKVQQQVESFNFLAKDYKLAPTLIPAFAQLSHGRMHKVCLVHFCILSSITPNTEADTVIENQTVNSQLLL